MSEIHEELEDYAALWRSEQPDPPRDLLGGVPTGRGRGLRVGIAALAVAGITLAGILLLSQQDGGAPPHVQSPSAPTSSSQPVDGSSATPKLDVTTMYLPIAPGDLYAAGQVGAEIGFAELPSSSGAPTQQQQRDSRACDIALPLSGVPSHFTYYEDPGWYRGTPSTPTFATPPPPSATPTCSPAAAKAALTIREINRFLDFRNAMANLESDPTITAARQQEIDCLHGRGIDSVSDDGFITDGWNQRHPDQSAQAKLDFADCIQGVVNARDQVRRAARDQYIANHRGAIDRLQSAFNDYLSAIYKPSPPTPESSSSLPDETFNKGCITVSNVDIQNAPTLTEEQIRQATGISTKGVAGMQGLVTVCNSAIDSRPLYVAWEPATATGGGTIYLLDPQTGVLVEQMPFGE